MTSIRKRVAQNVNASKNTRMDIATAGCIGDWRADILAHLSRYELLADRMIKLAGDLERPIDTLDIGCGECWPLRVLFRSKVIKKSDVVASFTGIDMDGDVLIDFATGNDVSESPWLRAMNGRVLLQDLTTTPALPLDTASIDLAWTTEVIEHMRPEFVEPWLAEVARVMRPGGTFYVSTPNHDGSREQLPKDHVYEWGYKELETLLRRYFKLADWFGTFGQLPRLRKAQREFESGGRGDGWPPSLLDVMEERFGEAWLRVIMAAPFPDVAQNVTWRLTARDLRNGTHAESIQA